MSVVPGTDRAGLERIVAQLEAAWNAMDGPAFAAPFASNAAGSTIRLTVENARILRADVALVHVHSVLDAPTGPLAGRHRARFSLVLTREPGGWVIAALHNTVEAGP